MTYGFDRTEQGGAARDARIQDMRIDATLRALGTITPADGLEGRVLARLRTERAAEKKISRFFRMTGPVFGLYGGLSGAALACALIVVASVGHSHHANAGLPPAVPVTGGGVGAASASHLAGPQPVTPAPQGHGRTHGKANGHAKKSAESSSPENTPNK